MKLPDAICEKTALNTADKILEESEVLLFNEEKLKKSFSGVSYEKIRRVTILLRRSLKHSRTKLTQICIQSIILPVYSYRMRSDKLPFDKLRDRCDGNRDWWFLKNSNAARS